MSKPNPITCPVLAAMPNIRHGFFTREGGVSNGLYAGLNCGLGSNDDRDKVVENRTRVTAHLGAAATDVLTLYQVHSADALVVDGPIPRDSRPKADAVVTRVPELAIGVLTADCTPVLFADAKTGVVAAAHAGWKGAIGGVLEATVAAMETLGAARGHITAAIGPTISQRFYEVGPEFEAAFTGKDPAFARFFTTPEGGRALFDLPGFVGHRLSVLGLAGVVTSAPCTYESESLFFSFRRATHRSEPDYGRQISAIVVT